MAIGISKEVLPTGELPCFPDPDGLVKMIGEIDQVTSYFYREKLLFALPPRKPENLGDVRGMVRYITTLLNYRRELEEAEASLPEKWVFERKKKNLGPLGKIKEGQRLIDEFNRSLFLSLLRIKEIALFGGKIDDLKAAIEEIYWLTAKIKKKGRGEDNDRVLDKIVPLVIEYRERAAKVGIPEEYRRLMRVISEKYGHLIKRADELVNELPSEDDSQSYYLPQLNVVASLDERGGVDLPIIKRGVPCLKIFSFYEVGIPLSSNLLVIPLNEIFPKPKEEPKEKTYREYETFGSFLKAIIEGEGEIDDNEVIEFPLPDRRIMLDLILKGINPFYPRRGELLRAGYVLLNRIGGKEKPIIDETYLINGEIVDLGSFSLLTREQLMAVMAKEKEEWVDLKINPRKIALIALIILHGPSYFEEQREREIMEEELASQLKSGARIIKEEIKKRVKERLNEELKEGKGFYFFYRREEIAYTLRKENPELSLKEALARAYLIAEEEWRAGKIRSGDPEFPLPKAPFPVPFRGLERVNFSCPFLECPWRIRYNMDCTYDDKQEWGRGYPRINTVSVHLMFHNLSERGDRSRSFDQRYLTIRQLYELFKEREDLLGLLDSLPEEIKELVKD